jgi:hypothetical protein
MLQVHVVQLVQATAVGTWLVAGTGERGKTPLIPVLLFPGVSRSPVAQRQSVQSPLLLLQQVLQLYGRNWTVSYLFSYP